MKAHVDAIKALLAPLSYGIYFVDVTVDNPAIPYNLIWCSSGVPFDDSLCGSGSDLSERVNITSVAGTTEGVLILQALVRGVLAGKIPTVTGRHVEPLKLIESQPIAVDRAVTLTDPNRHPAYGVDTYRLSSTPA